MTDPNNSFFSNKVQEIHTDLQGEVIQSSDSIFILPKGDNIFDLHPFFESMKSDLISQHETSLAFPCVQLDLQNKEVVCDITIKIERGFLAILLFDYSTHYEHLHDAAQEKKTALLNEQAHDLTAKHKEERRVYAAYMMERFDTNIISQLEACVQDLERLKKTPLSAEQDSLIADMRSNVDKLYQRAIQIKESLDPNSN